VQTTIKKSCLEDVCHGFEANKSSTYSVAWIDCVTTGRRLGRSVLTLGEHAEAGNRLFDFKRAASIPAYGPTFLLNRASIMAFNALYYHKARSGQRKNVPMASYFYPLDAIDGWNKLYGKPGFVQYQFVLPLEDGAANLRIIIKRIAESGLGSFLAVLKLFGEGNRNLISFPSPGFTLALDFKFNPRAAKLMRELDEVVWGMGGRVYLTKDALMTKAMFRKTYPRWLEFEELRAKYGAIGRFASDQSRRLGLQ
jgi:FAD/FMN-containing dehydrogenase